MRNKPTLPHGTVGEWLKWLMRRRRLVRVAGRSMLPTLVPGDLLFCDATAYQHSSPQIDEIVVAIHPQQSTLKIIKRIGLIEADGSYLLLSDNPREGSDSLSFGAISRSNIIGKVTGFAIPRPR